jgi:hypothetical protein
MIGFSLRNPAGCAAYHGAASMSFRRRSVSFRLRFTSYDGQDGGQAALKLLLPLQEQRLPPYFPLFSALSASFALNQLLPLLQEQKKPELSLRL